MQNQKLVVAAGSIASSRTANSTVGALVRARCERRRSGLETAR
jgi:hypothetical protein